MLVSARPGAHTCKELYYLQRLDHYDFRHDTRWQQRYLLNDTFWRRSGGALWLYAGNEGPVEGYADNTGLMWENAAEFGALLVFAEVGDGPWGGREGQLFSCQCMGSHCLPFAPTHLSLATRPFPFSPQHRYYGRSQPFGDGSVSKDPSYLTVEQAMSDYVELVAHLKGEFDAKDAPVIVFGGSYGGMLSAWLRMK